MDTNKTRMKRAEVNDPVALREIGVINYREGDYETTNEYWTKAAELGDVDTHYQLSTLYRGGKVLRWTRKRNYIFWKKRPSPVIPC